MANLQLDHTIELIFKAQGTDGYCHHSGTTEGLVNGYYMEIPFNSSQLEVPTFAFPTLFECLGANDDFDELDSIIVPLYSEGLMSNYVSMDKVMNTILRHLYKTQGLVHVDVTKLEERYYGTQGAIFDKYLNPVLMCSWLMEKTGNNNHPLELLRPIIRIHPSCFINQSDSLQRYIVKKFVSTAFNVNIPFPPHPKLLHRHGAALKVEIDDSPFVIKQVAVPSVSTTSEELLKTALDHIEDFI